MNCYLEHANITVESIDLDALIKRLAETAYKQNTVVPHPNRKRAYYYDSDQNEFEFIESLSDDWAERNDYSV
ncbi:MAG: hypothetical protein HKN25_03295 [Pyrinomonadaceae bacterium]|nr:hypothetical protein [Pyrinomonadaceae bacterium]